MDTTISFPGLGIGEFSVSRAAFSVAGKDIYWYGVIIMLGIVTAFFHAWWRAKHEKIKRDHVFDLALFIVPFGVLGARLYYVLTTLDSGNYKTFTDVIAIWEGGLAIYGGIIAGIATIVVVCLVKKLNVFKVFDMVGPGVMIAQAIGRWGNFCNGEAFGEVVPASHPLYFMRMGLVSDYAPAPMQYYHPTFLYESLWNVVGFVLITIFYRKKKFNGQNALLYLTWYGFGRMFIEGLRTDSLYVGPFRISQVVGLVCFVAGAAALTVGFILTHKGKMPAIFAVDLATVGEKEIAILAEETGTADEVTPTEGTDTAEGETMAEDMNNHNDTNNMEETQNGTHH